jgi:cyclopropane fatty-acyl-phospholipid synthase-like methyltransferase
MLEAKRRVTRLERSCSFEDFGLSYARTLAAWRGAFLAQRWRGARG